MRLENNSSIDRHSPVPIYHQIKELIKEKIEKGELKPDEKLPSETEMEDKLGVSRMTASKALSQLENEDYIYREQGKGSFVTPPKMRNSLLSLTSFSEDMEQRGFQPGGKILKSEIIKGNKEVAAKLETEPEEEVFALHRIRLADEEPLAIEKSYIRTSYCEGIDRIDFTNRSLYSIFEEKYGIQLHKAEKSIEAVPATKVQAKQLNIEAGDPVLSVDQTTHVKGERNPIEYMEAVYRGDQYKLLVQLDR